MLILVTGGSGSGKSSHAERLAVELYRNGTSDEPARLLYIATMAANGSDPETVKRIERHRAMRAGKSFETIEAETHLEEIDVKAGDVLLLEDLPNLLANEIWTKDTRIKDLNDAVRYTAGAVIDLCRKGVHVVVVTGEVTSDGRYDSYDEEMKFYLTALSRAGIELAAYADRVIESVAGIAVLLKK